MNADKRRSVEKEFDSQDIRVHPRSSAANSPSSRPPFNPGLAKGPLISNEHEVALNAITEKVIGCVFKVSNTLGCGFLEKVYENALAHELRKAGLDARQKEPVKVQYDGIVVGDYITDILVEGAVILELKAVKEFDDIHIAQCLNYLKATDLRLCLLINFGKPKVEIKRLVSRY